jgi:hypothetical protein
MSNSEEIAHQEKDSSKKEEKTVSEKFTEERIKWTGIIKDMSSRFKAVENLAEVQIDLYSNRQIAIEYLYKLIGIRSKLKKIITAEWKKAFEAAARNEDLRYSEKERGKLADAAVIEHTYNAEELSSQVDFFRETVKTIDSMTFGVKHRIEIENFKIGMK